MVRFRLGRHCAESVQGGKFLSKYSRVRTFRDPLGQAPLKSPVTPATLLLNFLSPPGTAPP
jgi:hypothetical protein